MSRQYVEIIDGKQHTCVTTWIVLFNFFIHIKEPRDHVCGLVATVPDCRSKGTGFDSRLYQIFREVADVERGLLSCSEEKLTSPV
jgi:hypothetical protein